MALVRVALGTCGLQRHGVVCLLSAAALRRALRIRLRHACAQHARLHLQPAHTLLLQHRVRRVLLLRLGRHTLRRAHLRLQTRDGRRRRRCRRRRRRCLSERGSCGRRRDRGRGRRPAQRRDRGARCGGLGLIRLVLLLLLLLLDIAQPLA